MIEKLHWLLLYAGTTASAVLAFEQFYLRGLRMPWKARASWIIFGPIIWWLQYRIWKAEKELEDFRQARKNTRQNPAKGSRN